MENQDSNLFLPVLLMLCLIFFFYLGAPSEADVEKCMDATGYDYARCLEELTR